MNDSGIPEGLRRVMTILIVERDAVMRRLAYRFLSENGCRLLEAADADEALAILRMSGPRINVIVIDDTLPNVGGTDLAGEVAVRWPHMQIVALSSGPNGTANGHEHRDERVVLWKPFTRGELYARIREAIGKEPATSAKGDPVGPCSDVIEPYAEEEPLASA